ncbi:mce related family protein [Mycobacterium avium subsp. avium 2285 (R)]|nr:mce related family protein [Mycobacterium avium subsp. avium 2285 (R)]
MTLTADRSGLIMEPGAKVKLRGVQVGRVTSIHSGDPVTLRLELYPEQLQYIPANVTAQITATTAFGGKYVDLQIPESPSPRRLAAGAVVRSRNVTTEVNTVFQNLVAVLNQVDTPKLNAVLTALGDGLRGKGEALGEATTDLNEVLGAINPRSETIRADSRALEGFSDTYSAAAHDIVTVLDAGSTTSATVSNNAQALDSLLLNVIGLSHSGIGLIGPNKDNLVHGVNLLESTTRLLMKYNPELTCTLLGSKYDAEFFGDVAGGHNGYSVTLDVALLLGDEAYRYPDNLPINGAKGGPGDSLAADRYPTCPRTSRCATSSPTPGGGVAWTCDPTPASVSPGTSTTCRSPVEHRSRPAFAIREGRHLVRCRTPVRHRTERRSTRRMERRCIRGCRPRLRRDDREMPARRLRGRNRSRHQCRGRSNRPAESSIRCANRCHRHQMSRGHDCPPR